MVILKPISDIHAREAIQAGEFGKELTASKPRVTIILTQSWCPQWTGLKRIIEKIPDLDIDAWYFVYDQSKIFREFLRFKEQMLGNDEIPYIRYYRNGVMTGDSNAVNIHEFLDKFL